MCLFYPQDIMVSFSITCMLILIVRDTVLSHFADLQGKNSEEYSFDSRDQISSLGKQKIARLNGDLRLGAMLPIHTSSHPRFCSELYVDGIVLVEAIFFALREVKNRQLLPEEITLGYEIRDTCNSVIVAQRHTLDIVIEATKYERNKENVMNGGNDTKVSYSTQDYKQSSSSLIAVVGAGNSEISVAVNRVLSAFNIPQIGFASTSRFLSEKLRFPSFFRTVPPDTYQVQGLIALFQKFSWSYVALLVSDGDYGRPLAESFRSSAKKEGICITYEHLVPFKVKKSNAKSIAKELKSKTNIEIVVILLPEPDVKTLLHAMHEIGLNNKTLIASDSWSMAIKDVTFSSVVAGTLGFAHDYKQVKKFEDYFLSLKPSNNTWNPWFNETWEYIFGCVISKGDNVYPNETSSHRRKVTLCNFENQMLTRRNFTRLHYVSNIIDAVFAVASAIKSLYKTGNNTVLSLTSQNLLETLKENSFQKYDGETIRFDENGDVSGKYNLVNIRPDLTTRSIGIWNGEYLELDTFERIWWSSGEQNPPKGVCSTPCSAGWFQHASKSDPHCCWTCHPCHAGTISNISGATKCFPCPEEHMTNFNQTACIFIPLNYLDWQSFWTISIFILALISVSFLLFVVMLFIRYVNTPVVKSSNRELSLLLGIGLFLTFLVPFAFAGKPTKLKCIVSQVMFCVGCALALSAMLFRTLRIVLLFGFTNRRRWLLKNKYQIAMTIALTFTELTYCLLWVAVNPPGVKNVIIRPTKRYLVCEFDKYWYGGSHLLLIFLSVVCTILAVKGRKLPKNFNEVRHIGLSMFTFNIVWVVFMCAQYGASLEYDVKINCFAMIISSLMILVLLFGPKVFVLLFRSHLNKKEEFEAEVRRFSFGVPSCNASASATSLRRGSSALLRTGPTNDHFLNVASDDLKRMRSQSFDAMASRLYHNAPRAPKSCSKETQTSFPPGDVDMTGELKKSSEIAITLKITEEQNADDLFARENKKLNETGDRKLADVKIIECNHDNGSNVTANVIKNSNSTNCLPELRKLVQDSDSETDRNIIDHSSCPNGLGNSLHNKDSSISNKNIANGQGNFFTELNEKPEKLKGTSNGKASLAVPRSRDNERTLSQELTQNAFLEINFNLDFDDERLKISEYRNAWDRETIC